jgi:hypothetical protein
MESAEGALSCRDLSLEAGRSRALTRQLEESIAANRGQNQAVGFVAAAVFPPLALAAQHNSDAKKILDEQQARRDRIDRLAGAKGCVPGASD